MENVLSAFLVILIILLATLSQAYSLLAARSKIDLAEQAMQERQDTHSRTRLVTVDAQASDDGSLIQMTLKNAGEVKLADFNRWDVIVEYYDSSNSYQVAWLPYTAPGKQAVNQWSVAGIFMDAGSGAPEIFEPGILNPGEQVVLQIQVMPWIGPGTTDRVVVSTGDGSSASAIFIAPIPPTPTPAPTGP